MKVVVLLVVGLRPKDLTMAPALRALGDTGFVAPLRPVFPAVTCSMQATFLTGGLPRDHGVVANGWYFRDLAQVWLWRQSNALVSGEKLYEAARARDPRFRCAKLFWWWNMHAAVDWSVTPRPEYPADGRKLPGLYTQPAELGPVLQQQLGPFPLFQFWGPGAGIASTRWIVDSALVVLRERDPTLTLVYLPHLDYDQQRYGPDDPRGREAVAALDREAARLIDAARASGAAVVALSEYGLERTERVVFLNRTLHQEGLLAVQDTSHGQLLDCGASRAFAVCDHQVAHVYVREPRDLARVQEILTNIAGVAEVWGAEQKRAVGLDHARSGELVCVAEAGCWFAYHYWLDERRRPDFAPTVDIHRKPGYDPAELFLDPALRFPKLKIARVLARKALGFRYLMDVIPTDPSLVRGTHGRLFADPDAGPVYLSSSPEGATKVVEATSVKQRLLALLSK